LARFDAESGGGLDANVRRLIAKLHADRNAHRQHGGGIAGTKARAIGEIQLIGGGGEKCTAQVEFGIGAKDDAVGIEQEEIGAAIGFD
jgi:hypothetical protein